MLEVLIYVAIVAVLLSILLPAMNSARSLSMRSVCADNQRELGVALASYLEEHSEFPGVAYQPSWWYGGVRYSSVTGRANIDHGRPLNPYVSRLSNSTEPHELPRPFCCPADAGITDSTGLLGTGSRTACEAFGTSYRANPRLFHARETDLHGAARGVRAGEITASPSRLLVLGDPVWYETRADTGRNADWHGEEGHGNLLFLDGAVRFQAVGRDDTGGPVLFEPDTPSGRRPVGEAETMFKNATLPRR